MITSVKDSVTGAETKVSSTTLVQVQAASGNDIIDVLLNGVSTEFGVDVTIDEATGNLVFNSLLSRGDSVLTVYKTLPRLYTISAMTDFESADFESADFA